MRRRRICKYSILNFFFLSYIVELIILLLVNFIHEKSLTFCSNGHSYFEKGNKYISTYKSQCFKEVYDFMLGSSDLLYYLKKKMLFYLVGTAKKYII